MNGIEHLNAPWEAFWARATNSFLPKSIETEVPKFKPLLVAALSKRIQLRVHLIKQITVLFGHRVSLHSIRPYSNDSPLMHDNAAMPLRTIKLQTQFFC